MTYSSKKFNFVTDLTKIGVPEDSFVVDIQEKISSQNELYDVYKKTITLPDYFGNNWNALFDSLKDLGWVPQKNIIIRHLVLPTLPDDEHRDYLEILIESIIFWTKFDRHKISVYFSIEAEGKIKELLSGSIV